MMNNQHYIELYFSCAWKRHGTCTDTSHRSQHSSNF